MLTPVMQMEFAVRLFALVRLTSHYLGKRHDERTGADECADPESDHENGMDHPLKLHSGSYEFETGANAFA